MAMRVPMSDSLHSNEHVPGFKTVWKAEAAGPRQQAVCPRCNVEIGSVGQKEKVELLCRQCMTIYQGEGQGEDPPKLTPARKTIVVEGLGDSRLGDALRGKRPACFKFTTGDAIANIIIIILLFIAIALAIQ